MNINNNTSITYHNIYYAILGDKNIIKKELNKKPSVEGKNVSPENELEKDETVNEVEKIKGKKVDTKA